MRDLTMSSHIDRIKELEEQVAAQAATIEAMRAALAAHVDELVAICNAYETQVDELTREIDEDNALREKLTRLLEGTAKGLKGEPPDDVWWDWSDLPALAERYRLGLEEIACKAGTPQDVSVIAKKALFKLGGD